MEMSFLRNDGCLPPQDATNHWALLWWFEEGEVAVQEERDGNTRSPARGRGLGYRTPSPARFIVGATALRHNCPMLE